MKNVIIAGAVRTPIGKYLGALKSFTATELGACVIREVLQRAKVPAGQVDEVIFGNVLGAGLGQNPARQAALKGGLPPSVPAFTLNKVCGSGLKAVVLAAQAIQCGDADVVVAGGMESMTHAPHFLRGVREGYRLGNLELVDSLIHDGLLDAFENMHMGLTAELVAEKYHLSRKEIDEWSVRSHQRASQAQREGGFKHELLSLEVPQKKGQPSLQITQDEGPRDHTSLEQLSALKPAFKKDGVVTAGNASQLSDGASALILTHADKARELGLQPLARILGYSSGGVEPKWVMMAPVEALQKLERKIKRSLSDYDLVEINEAFAAQTCALLKELSLNPERLNVHGGAVALGHPLGASGARMLTTLLYALHQRNKNTGLATLCLGGGGAVALAVERLS